MSDSVCWILGCIFALAAGAQAAFVNPYALNNFMLINTNADGTAMTPDGGLSVVLTGGNNGSGEPGTTDLVTTAKARAIVQFNYSYSSLDIAHQDFAGYLVGNAFTQIADISGQMGMVSFMVSLGQTFGFRVGTVDNQFEPGILTLSSFSGPATSTRSAGARWGTDAAAGGRGGGRLRLETPPLAGLQEWRSALEEAKSPHPRYLRTPSGAKPDVLCRARTSPANWSWFER